MTFQSLGINPRLQRALEKKGLTKPTSVQVECIKQALEGRDVIARAPTGSGKTLAYILPILQRLLELPSERQASPWQSLVLVPTRELCEQVRDEAAEIAQTSGLDVTVTALTASGAAEREQFLHIGQIVIATPGRVAQAIKNGRLRPQMLQPHEQSRRTGLHTLVLDEADLILSMPGYGQDLQEIAPRIPRSCQCLLMSATTNEDVDKLQKLVLHNPIVLDLVHAAAAEKVENGLPTTGPGSASQIQHHSIHCPREDKLLYVMTLLKLNLVKRKVLLFVNTIEAAFRMRLFLESFGLRSASINAELPLNTRHHILQEFNRGIFDYLIATDSAKKPDSKAQEDGPRGGGKQGKKRKHAELDGEFGVIRGVDFKGVETVINADAPSSVQSYVHRVGRTGRAGNSGTAITLLTPNDKNIEEELSKALCQNADPNREDSSNVALEPFSKLQKTTLEALRYRAEGVMRSITSKVIKEMFDQEKWTYNMQARAKELRLELINSQKLAAHFEQHPGELVLLKHDKSLARKPDAPHLKHLPPYLQAAGMPASTGPGPAGGVLSSKKRKAHNKGVDPIKGGFMKAPRRRNAEPLTEMEQEAEKLGKKLAKKQRKVGVSQAFTPKKNVRKRR